MRLYLVQHGAALPRELDSERPLSDAGRAEVQRLAAFLENRTLSPSHIQHSGKTRARQTAELLAEVMPGAMLEARSGLDPMDPVKPLAYELEERSEDVMLVGHQPFMGRLASFLAVEDEGQTVVAFQPGTMVCLEQADNGDWAVAWMLRPDLLG
jgi:phosphohistidine phosphatase